MGTTMRELVCGVVLGNEKVCMVRCSRITIKGSEGASKRVERCRCTFKGEAGMIKAFSICTGEMRVQRCCVFTEATGIYI